MVILVLLSLHASPHFHEARHPQVGMRTENRQWIKAQFQKK